MALVLFVGQASARTILLTAEELDQMAVLNAKAPKVAWTGMLFATNKVHSPETSIHFYPEHSLLMQFSFAKIPKDSRIAKAEFFMPVDYIAGGSFSMSVRRVTAEWGHGVNNLHRMQYPEKHEWAQPGARGAGTDRAAKVSGVFKVDKAGEYMVDVTEDVELWFTGAAPNRGWVLTNEPTGGIIYVPAPYGARSTGSKRWKLQITYEPQ